jgi:hypothetical protein
VEPSLASFGLKAVAPGLVKAFGALRREFARRDSGYGEQDFLWGIDDILDEALAVLAREGDTVIARARSGISGMISRPSLFVHAQPAAWIATEAAQYHLKGATLALLRGESDADFAAAATSLYDSFDGDFPGSPPAPTAADAYAAALRYIERSLARDVTIGERLILHKLDAMHEPAAADTSDIVDAHVESELRRIRQRRYFRSASTREQVIALARNLGDGRLRSASPPVKARAFAWCSRLVVYSDPGLAQDYCEMAYDLGGQNSEEYRVAIAFLAATDNLDTALGMLGIGQVPIETTAALQILRKKFSPAETRARAEAAGIFPATLDPDGRSVWLSLLLELDDWEGALDVIGSLTRDDFDVAPVLLWLAGTSLVAAPLPSDLQNFVRQDVPPEPASFRFPDDERAIAARREARRLMQAAHEACLDLDLSGEATVAARYELWLGLRDPDSRVDALAELTLRVEEPATLVAFLPLALAFDIELDRSLAERAVERQVARRGSTPQLLAGALMALALDHGPRRPAEGLALIERHRSLLTEYFDVANLIALEIYMLMDLGRIDDARARLAAVDPEMIPPAIRARLAARIERADPRPSVEELEALYSENGQTVTLGLLVNALREEGFSERYLEHARRLVLSARNADDAKSVIDTLVGWNRDEEAWAILDELGEIAWTSSRLLQHRAWIAFRAGRFVEADAALTELESRGDSESNRALRYQLLVSGGNWAKLDAFIDEQWKNRNERSPLELVQCATLAARLGSKWTADLVRNAAERAPDDAEVLVAAYTAVTSAGLEEEVEEAIGWLMRAAETSGENGPVQQTSLAELLEGQPEWNERVERAQMALAAGDAPMESIAAMLRRPWLELQIIPLLANGERSDVRQHSVTSLFSGRKRADEGFAPGVVAFDRTAAATLATLGLLEATLDAFDGAIISHGLLSDFFEQLPRIKHHQPSKVRFARDLSDMLQRGTVSALTPTTTADPGLVADIGHSLAALLTEAQGQDEGQHIVVHPYPVTRVGSLRSEPVQLDEYAEHICSCSAVVDTLERLARLTRGEMARARTYLDGTEKRWPHEPRIERGATLYLSDLSVDYFRYIGLLAKIEAAGLTVIIAETEIAEARTLREWDAQAEKVGRAIEEVRSVFSRAITDGRLIVDRAGEEDEDQAVVAIASLAHRADYLLCDDRFVNRYENFDGEEKSTRIIATSDVIDHLEARGSIDTAHAIEARTRLRRGGAIFMPLHLAELEAALGSADVEEGVLRENAELRAIRENLRLAQLRGWFDPTADTAWMVETNGALLLALIAQWTNAIDDETARARSNWLAALMGARAWTDSLVKPGLFNLGSDSIILDLGRYAFAYFRIEGEAQERFSEWLEAEVMGPAWEAEPRIKPMLLDHLRGSLLSLAPDFAIDDGSVDEAVRIQLALQSLPPFLQFALLEDKDFRELAQLEIGYAVNVGEDAEFARQEFIDAVKALYASPADTVSLTDETGREWTLTTDQSEDVWPVTLRSGEERRRTRGILALLPTPEMRLDALDKVVCRAGISADSMAVWRSALQAGTLDADGIEALDSEIASWPMSIAPGIGASLARRRAAVSTLVPPLRAYFDHLAGAGEAASIDAYINDIAAPHLAAQSGAAPLERARNALLLASHPKILADDRFPALSADEWTRLGEWALDEGDLLSRIGYIELALPRTKSMPALEPILVSLINDMMALDPEDPHGPLSFFANLIILAEGEVSRAATLADLRPFQRRIATFAHAALIERFAQDFDDRERFGEFCVGERGGRFFIQSLADLRIEPRWRPEYLQEEQLRNEFLGRIFNCAGSIDADALPPALHALLLGEEDSLRSIVAVPQAFWPGPIEGAIPEEPSMLPDNLAGPLEAVLDTEALDLEDISLLINMETVFHIPDALVEGIAERLKAMGPRLFKIIPEDRTQAHLVGLAYLAASHRRPDLADHLKTLARYRRNLAVLPSMSDEIQLALSASAAHKDRDGWRSFLGGWLREVAVHIESEEDAGTLLGWLDMLCQIDPGLHASTGRARAALLLMFEY